VCEEAADAGATAEYVGPAHAACFGRPTALKRAFANLVDNAVKYGERARVTLETASASLVVTIEDDGPGVPTGELDRVFEPFYRLETSRSRETGGAGLGLALVRAAVAAHGGDVMLGNRPEGGLRATVTLPVGAGVQAEEAQPWLHAYPQTSGPLAD
jgi:signal transduction histidine kinase